MTAPSATPSLFERLGGRDGLHRILSRFYERARLDPLLGPVFAAHVDDWPRHLETVVDFWSNHTGGPVRYRGGMGRHLRLGLREEHFGRWLALWGENAVELADPDCARELVEIAGHVAGNLRAMQAQVSALRPGS